MPLNLKFQTYHPDIWDDSRDPDHLPVEFDSTGYLTVDQMATWRQNSSSESLSSMLEASSFAKIERYRVCRFSVKGSEADCPVVFLFLLQHF